MTYQEYRECIVKDARNANQSLAFWDRLRSRFAPSYSYEYVRLLRKYHYYKTSGSCIKRLWAQIIRFRLHRKALKLGFYIPEDVFGPGLSIPHFGSIIVNPFAKIGHNCHINNNVVIGQVEGKCPVIGDNVFIGTGAVICGDIHIADNVWIGANSVVTKSVEEEGVLIAGAPAKIICSKEQNWLEESGIKE